MSGKPTVAHDVVRAYLKEHPTAPNMTAAKALYRHNPELWNSLETCRTMVRYIRGNKSGFHRDAAADKSQYRPNGKAGEIVFPDLPEGIVELNDYGTFDIPGPCKVLQLSDTHIPYHDRPAILAACGYMKPDIIVLNGDIIDCFAQSAYCKDPREVDFPNEVRCTREFFLALRSKFKHARIIHKWGNHEQRFARYMWLKAPELLGIDECRLSHILHCEDYDMEVIENPVPIKVGKLHVVHGHEWKRALTNPVNPARGLYLKAQVSSMCGHLHQTSQHSDTRLDEHTVSCWSSGCLSDLHPRWMPVNKWNHGFLAYTIDKEGGWEVRNPRIIAGKVYD